MKSKYIQIRISEEDKRELAEISERLDVPASQIVREGVRQKIDDLKQAAETVAANSELAVQQ